MKRMLLAGVASLLVAGLWGGSAAVADDGVDRRGACSAGRSEWRLRVDPDDGRLEVRFKVNQHRPSNDVWNVTVTRNGTAIFQGQRVGRGADGEFEVRRTIADLRGADAIVGRAVNQRSGVVCRGAATI